MAPHGTDSTTRSARAASAGSAAAAPISAARAFRPDRSRAKLTVTSYPASAPRRAMFPPMCPAPMTPSLIVALRRAAPALAAETKRRAPFLDRLASGRLTTLSVWPGRNLERHLGRRVPAQHAEAQPSPRCRVDGLGEGCSSIGRKLTI